MLGRGPRAPVTLVELLQTKQWELCGAEWRSGDWFRLVWKDIKIPLTVVGESSSCPNSLILHSPGLPGGFFVPYDDFGFAKRIERLSAVRPPTANELASRCLARFFTTASVASSVSTSPFLQLLQLMFATHAALEGLVAACSISESLARCGIECHPSFPYHCGVGPSATKCHFDTRPNILAAFHPALHHGGKYLTPSGTVVCVGVAPLSTTTECGSCSGADLSVFFHPTGCPACAAMPQLHSPTQRFLHIGEEALEPNGPDPRVSRLLTPDPIDSFLHPTRLHENGQIYDETKWLCQGLFGECAGADLTGHPGHTVVGIQTKPGGAPCLELYCTEKLHSASVLGRTEILLTEDD